MRKGGPRLKKGIEKANNPVNRPGWTKEREGAAKKEGHQGTSWKKGKGVPQNPKRVDQTEQASKTTPNEDRGSGQKKKKPVVTGRGTPVTRLGDCKADGKKGRGGKGAPTARLRKKMGKKTEQGC